MERTVLFVFLYVAAEAGIGKHVYVPKSLKWREAQAYCRENHTDLSHLNSQSDIDKLRKAAGGKIHKGWIGLQRDPDNRSAWTWSGGDHITFQNWHDGQPRNRKNEDVGSIGRDGTWFDSFYTSSVHFYCVDVDVEEEKTSWEDALSRCRENQTDLSSLLSETDRLLVQTEIQNRNITERLWIGLRFLGDRWMWVNGDPLEYEAWSQQGGQDHQCPIRRRCGALTRDGLWENRDCQDKLSFICA
ncbi:macrophage mannose receptor 1-like [Acanthochromis polyacanthus]|uniref:macrophage mannose receptor 1-like n=1 Tax=Acanthochromis polyacanthus TaxID=80966 RepID=UPI002234BB8C|nr:macrophage mannose receptor 1-like [Acanthochromis polyacanthus]